MGIELNTNTWGFKCAFTCTHRIVGWDLSLPYRRTSITSRSEVCPMSVSSYFLYLYIIVTDTENTNSNSPWWSIQWPIWGKVSHTHALLSQCVIDINWPQISTEQVFQWPQLFGLKWRSASISTTCGPIHLQRALGKTHAPLFQTLADSADSIAYHTQALHLHMSLTYCIFCEVCELWPRSSL